MSNKASNNLHQLIHSLSKPEKRYFKIYSSKHIIGDVSNYQRLFDAVSRQETYDEEQIIRKFKKEAFVRRFSITKNRLYNTILKSLDAYHSNSSIEAQVKRQLHFVEILYHKSLYKQARKVLKGVRKSAEKNELLPSLLEISKWEKRLKEQFSYQGDDTKSLKKHSQKDKETLEKLRHFHELWEGKSILLNQLYKIGKARSNEDRSAYTNAIQHILSEGEKLQSTVENTYLYNHTLSAYYFAINEYKSCYQFLDANLKHLQAHPKHFNDEPNIYLSVLSNTIFVGNQLGEFEASKELLRKLKSLPAELGDKITEDMEVRIFTTHSNLELSLFLTSGNFDQGLKIIPRIEEELIRFESKLSTIKKAQFYFNIAVVCFGAEQYNEALKWINQLLNNIGIDESLDIHCFAQLFNLIIHLELGNKSLLSYALRSTQRYLETRNRVYKFESVFLSFVNESLHKRVSESDKERYTLLAKELKDLQEDPYEKTVFEYFNFLAWARSKVNEISFAESVRASS